MADFLRGVLEGVEGPAAASAASAASGASAGTGGSTDAEGPADVDGTFFAVFRRGVLDGGVEGPASVVGTEGSTDVERAAADVEGPADDVDGSADVEGSTEVLSGGFLALFGAIF